MRNDGCGIDRERQGKKDSQKKRGGGEKERGILEKAGLVLVLDVVAELGLTLEASKGAGLIQSDGVSPVEDRIASLDEEQVELDGIARVHIAVREKVFAP